MRLPGYTRAALALVRAHLDTTSPGFKGSAEMRALLGDPSVRQYMETWVLPRLVVALGTETVYEQRTARRDMADAYNTLLREYDALRAERDALQRFKNFVHKRLDDAGVPVDPPGEHRDAGCRIGQRLDWLMAQLEEREWLQTERNKARLINGG